MLFFDVLGVCVNTQYHKSQVKTSHLGHFLAVLMMAVGICLLSWNEPDSTWAGGDAAAINASDQTGVNISEFTNVDALGFLSPDRVEPWGRILSDETERIFLSRGDTVYVTFEKGHDVKPGDLFTVYRSTDSVEDPISGRDAGFVISFLGKIVLTGEVKPGLYKGEIVESYRHIEVGFPVLPSRPNSPCVLPIDPEWKRFESIKRGQMVLVAGKDLSEYLGQYSVVYLSHGVNSGIHRGNLFEILGRPEAKEAPDLVLGYLFVLEARPETATGIVISSKREFLPGAVVWPVNLKESLHKVAIYYGEDEEKLKTASFVEALQSLKKRVGSDLDLPQALRVISRLPTCVIK